MIAFEVLFEYQCKNKNKKSFTGVSVFLDTVFISGHVLK